MFQPPLHSFGLLIHRWRWGVVGAWALLALAALPLAPRAPAVLTAGGFGSSQLEASRASTLISDRFGFSPASVLVVFVSDTLLATDPAYQAAVDDTMAGVRYLPQVAQIVTARENPRQVAPNGYVAYAVVALHSLPEDFRSFLPALRANLQPGVLEVHLTGVPVFYSDIQEVTERDLRRAEFISLPFAALALIFVFRSLVAAALPGVIGGTAVITTLALMVLISTFIPLSIFALNLVTMLGLGLGIDYSLFITSRFREELRRHKDVAEAVGLTVATAGRAVFLSGLAVLLGLSALLTFQFMALRSMGLAGGLVVALAVLASMTLLPALLSILGHRVDSLSLPRLGKPKNADQLIWSRLANAVMAHPWRVLLPVVAVLVGLGIPFVNVRLGAPDASILPEEIESRRAFELLQRSFGPGELTPILIVLESDQPALQSNRIEALVDYARRVQADPRVLRVDSAVTLDSRLTTEQYELLYQHLDNVPDAFARAALQQSVRGNTMVLQVIARTAQTDDQTKKLVEQIRATPPPPGTRVQVGGGTASVLDYVDQLYRDFPIALALVLGATYLVLLFSFRSVLLPAKAIVMNVLSLFASYGALVVVFQDGWLMPFGISRIGFVEASLPIVMFCVLFGLSMDYEVFLLSRIREAYLRGGDNVASVAQGLEGSGRIITSAALIIVLVSGSFVFADIALIKALGFGTAIAVLLDATVVRALLVPATMRLLGDWNWWAPAWMQSRASRKAADPPR